MSSLAEQAAADAEVAAAQQLTLLNGAAAAVSAAHQSTLLVGAAAVVVAANNVV